MVEHVASLPGKTKRCRHPKTPLFLRCPSGTPPSPPSPSPSPFLPTPADAAANFFSSFSFCQPARGRCGFRQGIGVGSTRIILSPVAHGYRARARQAHDLIYVIFLHGFSFCSSFLSCVLGFCSLCSFRPLSVNTGSSTWLFSCCIMSFTRSDPFLNIFWTIVIFCLALVFVFAFFCVLCCGFFVLLGFFQLSRPLRTATHPHLSFHARTTQNLYLNRILTINLTRSPPKPQRSPRLIQYRTPFLFLLVRRKKTGSI